MLELLMGIRMFSLKGTNFLGVIVQGNANKSILQIWNCVIFARSLETGQQCTGLGTVRYTSCSTLQQLIRVQIYILAFLVS